MSGTVERPEKQFAELFDNPPSSLGSQGDVALWNAMKLEAAKHKMPVTEVALKGLLFDLFESLCGQRIDAGEPFRGEGFSDSDPASGEVCPQFWRSTAIPVLVARFHELREPTVLASDSTVAGHRIAVLWMGCLGVATVLLAGYLIIHFESIPTTVKERYSLEEAEALREEIRLDVRRSIESRGDVQDDK